MPSENKSSANKADKTQMTKELTKTKAKKCLMINFGDETERKNILKEIKKNYPAALTKKLDNGFSNESLYQFNMLVELGNPKIAKQAKESLKKIFNKKPISIDLALNQKKKVESEQRKSSDAPEPKKESAVPNGAMADRSRGTFEIRIPKIIIRNLNFNAKEELLKKEMEKFGPVTLINLPKKPDGKPKGFGFVVFDKLSDAKEAIETLNSMKNRFMGTKVACDWCIPKNIFIKNTEEAKSEPKETPKKSKSDNKSDEESGEDSEKESDEDEDQEDKEDEKSNASDDDKPKKTLKRKLEDKPKEDKFLKKRQNGTQDVQEQKTCFIRNLSYDTTEESISEGFSFFGPIRYVKICKDRDLERPKGTAFVCFEESQHAINACAESDMFEIDSRKVQIDIAVSRAKAYDIIQDRKAADCEPKDNRNLALAKEGVIYANSYEANEVSKADMIRRQKLEESNRLKLQILHYFVSPTRLSVHNLPIKCSDDELRSIFQNAIDEGSGRKNENGTFKKSEITECRIMRDLTRVNSEGVHRSKGFGFIELTTTALATKALTAVNNKDVFKGGPKPIVQFSIEDMRALKKKQERYEKTQADFKKRSFSTTHKKPNGRVNAKNMTPRDIKKGENKRFNKAPGEKEPSKNNNNKKDNSNEYGKMIPAVKKSNRPQQKFKKKKDFKKD